MDPECRIAIETFRLIEEREPSGKNYYRVQTCIPTLAGSNIVVGETIFAYANQALLAFSDRIKEREIGNSSAPSEPMFTGEDIENVAVEVVKWWAEKTRNQIDMKPEAEMWALRKVIEKEILKRVKDEGM